VAQSSGRSNSIAPRATGDVLLACLRAGCIPMDTGCGKLIFGVARLKADTYVAEVRNKIGAELCNRNRATGDAEKHSRARMVSSMRTSPRRHHRKTAAGAAAECAGGVELGSWPGFRFSVLAKLGNIDREELVQTFNLGVV